MTCMTHDMQKVVYALKIKYNSIINTCNIQQSCKTKPDSVTDVCGEEGGEVAVSLCKLCLQLPSKEKQYKYTLS